jgi:3'-5' exoribonuclease
MSIQTISALKTGDSINSNFMITKIENKTTKTGKPYKAVQLRNATGIICMNVWDNMFDQLHDINAQDVVHIVGSKDDFGISLYSLHKVDPKTVNMADYYDMGNQTVIKKEYTQIMDYVERTKNRYLKALLLSFFGDSNIAQAFKAHSAAKVIHQAYVGGLVNHTLHVAQICEYYSSQYPAINRDLLITAALLHDVGKTVELSEFPANDYTDEGTMLGHIVIGLEMVSKHCAQISGFPDELKEELMHCIASHHGKLEYGSPVAPHIIEAIALHRADEVDAALTTASEQVSQTQDYQFVMNKATNTTLRKTKST